MAGQELQTDIAMKHQPTINIHNQDCMEAMAKMEDNAFELAIVDPEYGQNDAIGLQDGSKQKAKRKQYKIFKNEKPIQEYFKELKRVSRNQIIWGANFFGFDGGFICWVKNQTVFGEAELAYCSFINHVKVFEYTWNGMLQGNMKNKEQRIHPTQKPVALYKWLLKNYANEGDKILDTHLGSGSIAIACHDMGFDLEGYEIDQEYHQAALQRLNTHRSQLQMF